GPTPAPRPTTRGRTHPPPHRTTTDALARVRRGARRRPTGRTVTGARLDRLGYRPGSQKASRRPVGPRPGGGVTNATQHAPPARPRRRRGRRADGPARGRGVRAGPPRRDKRRRLRRPAAVPAGRGPRPRGPAATARGPLRPGQRLLRGRGPGGRAR